MGRYLFDHIFVARYADLAFLDTRHPHRSRDTLRPPCPEIHEHYHRSLREPRPRRHTHLRTQRVRWHPHRRIERVAHCVSPWRNHWLGPAALGATPRPLCCTALHARGDIASSGGRADERDLPAREPRQRRGLPRAASCRGASSPRAASGEAC